MIPSRFVVIEQRHEQVDLDDGGGAHHTLTREVVATGTAGIDWAVAALVEQPVVVHGDTVERVLAALFGRSYSRDAATGRARLAWLDDPPGSPPLLLCTACLNPAPARLDELAEGVAGHRCATCGERGGGVLVPPRHVTRLRVLQGVASSSAARLAERCEALERELAVHREAATVPDSAAAEVRRFVEIVERLERDVDAIRRGADLARFRKVAADPPGVASGVIRLDLVDWGAVQVGQAVSADGYVWIFDGWVDHLDPTTSPTPVRHGPFDLAAVHVAGQPERRAVWTVAGEVSS